MSTDPSQTNPNPHIKSAAEYEKMRDEAKAKGDNKAFAMTSNDLGVALYLEGKMDDARRVIEEARATFAGMNDAVGQGFASGNLARVEDRLGHRDKAVGLYQQAADFFKAGGDTDNQALTLRMLSQMYFGKGDMMMALLYYTRALEAKPKRNAFDNFLLWLYKIPLNLMGIKTQA